MRGGYSTPATRRWSIPTVTRDSRPDQDVIISGGENISSVGSRGAVLLRHPAVQEVAVVAWLTKQWGESPHAFVVLKPGAGRPRKELRQFTRDRLAHFKAPPGGPLCDGASRRPRRGRFKSSSARRKGGYCTAVRRSLSQLCESSSASVIAALSGAAESPRCLRSPHWFAPCGRLSSYVQS